MRVRGANLEFFTANMRTQTCRSPPALAPVVSWRDSDLALEDHAQILRMLKSAPHRNFLERERRIREQLTHAVEADVEDLRVRRAVEQFEETLLEDASRYRDHAQHVRDVDRVAGVFPNEAQCLHNMRVLERKNIRRLARMDAERRNAGLEDGRRVAAHEAFEQGGRFVTGASRIRDDTRERRVGQFAEQFVIIDTDDGDLLRNGELEIPISRFSCARFPAP